MTIQSVTLSPTDDTYINATAATTNYGTATSLYLGSITNGSNMKRVLMHFGGLSDGTIPKNAIITSAKFELYLTGYNSGYDRGIALKRMIRSWVANEATWNIASTGVSWGTAGATNTTTDYEDVLLGLRSVGKADLLNDYKNVLLNKTYIQEMVWGTFTNNGFWIDVYGGWADEFIYSSVDHATSGQRPKLTVEYIVPTQLDKYRRDRQPGLITGI